MALRNGRRFIWPAFDQGVDHEGRTDQTTVTARPRRLLTCENAIWRGGGLERRLGTALIHNPNDYVPITGGIRFYRGSTKETLVSSGSSIYSYNADHSVRTSLSLPAAMTANLQTFMVAYRTGLTDDTIRVYISNATDAPMVASGNPAAISAFAPTNLPTDVKQFIPHQDRLFAICTTNPLHLWWPPSLNPGGTYTTLGQTIGIPSSDPALTAAISHKFQTSDTGTISELILCTASQTWAVIGTQGWGPPLVNFMNNDAIRLHNVSGNIGTLSPKSLVNTPVGLIFLGRTFGRNQLMLLSGFGDETRVYPIFGIRADLNAIPVAALSSVSATYADGYYMLSYTLEGDTVNRREFWLNTEGLSRIPEGLWGPFYGPMIRAGNITGISVYIPFPGGTDNNELYVGDAGSGRLYQIQATDDDEGGGIAFKVRTPWQKAERPMRVGQFLVNAERRDGSATCRTYFDYGARTLDGDAAIIPVSSRIGSLVIGTGTIGGQETGVVSLPLDDAATDTDLTCEAFSQEVEFATPGTPFKLHEVGAWVQPMRYQLDRVSK